MHTQKDDVFKKLLFGGGREKKLDFLEQTACSRERGRQ